MTILQTIGTMQSVELKFSKILEFFCPLTFVEAVSFLRTYEILPFLLASCWKLVPFEN